MKLDYYIGILLNGIKLLINRYINGNIAICISLYLKNNLLNSKGNKNSKSLLSQMVIGYIIY